MSVSTKIEVVIEGRHARFLRDGEERAAAVLTAGGWRMRAMHAGVAIYGDVFCGADSDPYHLTHAMLFRYTSGRP